MLMFIIAIKDLETRTDSNYPFGTEELTDMISSRDVASPLALQPCTSCIEQSYLTLAARPFLWRAVSEAMFSASSLFGDSFFDAGGKSTGNPFSTDWPLSVSKDDAPFSSVFFTTVAMSLYSKAQYDVMFVKPLATVLEELDISNVELTNSAYSTRPIVLAVSNGLLVSIFPFADRNCTNIGEACLLAFDLADSVQSFLVVLCFFSFLRYLTVQLGDEYGMFADCCTLRAMWC